MKPYKHQVKHAKLRARQRGGVQYSNQDLEMIALAIVSQQTDVKFIRRISNRVKLYEVKYGDKTHTVLYNSKTKSIATFLDGLQIKF